MARLLIIGNGMAGLRFLEELVERAPNRFDITVLGAEPVAAYNRVLLTSLLAGAIGADDVRLRPDAWYAGHAIKLLTGQAALGLDVTGRRVVLCGGRSLPFDTLVLATGATPIRLDVPGADLAGVATLRTLEDIDHLARAAAVQPVVVIGGGALGIEAAHGLARRGARVSLVQLADRLMERQLDPEGARLLAAAIEASGVHVLLGAEVRAVRGSSRVEAVELADGRRLECHLAVMAIGIRPATALAAKAGLEVRRGIVVDDRMQTSAAGILAIGECAEHRGICYGLLEPCYAQARVAAATLSGEVQSFAGAMPATHLKLSAMPVCSIGALDADNSIIMRDAGAPSYRKLTVADGRLKGAVLVGDTENAQWYEELIRAGTSVAPLGEKLAFGPAFAEAA
jgi:nitrite reductase (NADH) large subunit